MIDSRLGFTELDRRLLDFVGPRVAGGAVRLLVLLTKCDKLNRRERQVALARAHEVLGEIATVESDIGVALFSALSGEGVGDAARVIRGWSSR
jgi:GTP-binding protein